MSSLQGRPCIALSERTGQRCERATTDSTQLCVQHRQQFQALLEASLLHCHTCPLLVRLPSGKPDREATLARCPMAFKHAKKGEPAGDSPCAYEVMEYFAPLGTKEDIADAMEETVRTEMRLLKRASRFPMSPERPANEVLRLSDQVVRHTRELAEFKGLHVKAAPLKVPEDQAAALVDALLHGGEPVHEDEPSSIPARVSPPGDSEVRAEETGQLS